MAAAASQALKPVSMANGCLTSLHTIFASKTPQSSRSIFPSIPIKFLRLSCSSSTPHLPQFLSSKRKLPSPPLVQTSDWAQQQHGESAALADSEGEGEEVGEGEEQSEAEGDGSYPEPPEEAKLFVGNLSFDIDSEMLAQLFEPAGVVEVAEVIYNRETDQSRGFGFVTMSTVEEAEKAVEMFNRYDVSGRLLTVNKAAPRGTRIERAPRQFETSLRIYVGNLPWQVDDARLEQVFSEHGKVVDAKVVYDRETGRSRGFGFVTMASKTELDDAIAALDGQTLDGRALRVNVAEERQRRGPF